MQVEPTVPCMALELVFHMIGRYKQLVEDADHDKLQAHLSVLAKREEITDRAESITKMTVKAWPPAPGMKLTCVVDAVHFFGRVHLHFANAISATLLTGHAQLQKLSASKQSHPNVSCLLQL